MGVLEEQALRAKMDAERAAALSTTYEDTQQATSSGSPDGSGSGSGTIANLAGTAGTAAATELLAPAAATAAGATAAGATAAGVTAGMAPLGGGASTFVASQVPISLGGTMGAPVASSGMAMPTAGAAAGAAVAAIPALLGMFGGVPSGAEKHRRLEEARKNAILAPILEELDASVPEGMSRLEYNESRKPPMTPIEQEIQALEKSGVGDLDYEVDQLRYQFMNGDRKGEMDAYYKANPEWFNPDGTRTGYAGPFAPSLEEQYEAVKNYATSLSIEQQNAITATGIPTQSGVPTKYDQSGVPTSSDQTGDPAATDPVVDTPAVPTVPAPPAGSNPIFPPGTAFQYTPQQMADNEFMTPMGKLLGAAAYASNDNLALQAAQSADLGIPDVTKIAGSLPTLEEVMATMPADAIAADVQSQVSQRYLQAEAAAKQTIADFQVFQGSTVKEQFAMLQDDWVGTNGQNKVPFYALGPVTAAKQAMTARGMGGSSMAAAAITQAGLEAMMPVAMADAQFMQTLSIKSFDQQTAIGMAKLSHIANLDMADLNYQQQRAVDTANKFFQMNMSNVDNERLVAVTNNANQMQALFTDQAAQNAAANLGFSTQAQQDQFYDQMALQAQESTARLLLSNNQFNASVENSRMQFNATMSAEIERDNINYLRAVNTANTAGINQQNLVNTQNLLGISNTAIANDLTLRRDELNRIFEASENMASRMNNYAIAQLQAETSMNRLTSQQDHESSAAIGGFLTETGSIIVSGLVDKYL